MTHGFFVRRCFPRISLAVSVNILLKVLVSKFTSVSLSSYWKGCKFPTYHCFECFCYIRILKFLDVKFDSCWFVDHLQANVEGCHHQVMITSDICSWKASCPGNVHSCVKALFHQDVVDLIVMFSIWAVPSPSSRCFVWAKCVSQHQLIVHCKFEEPVTSLICFRVAERSTNVMPVGLRILSHFCIPVS